MTTDCGCNPLFHCRLCELAGRPTPNRSASPVTVNAVSPAPAPCVHRGEPATARTIALAGGNPARAHVWCENPVMPFGVVDTCGSCGSATTHKCRPDCAGYQRPELRSLSVRTVPLTHAPAFNGSILVHRGRRLLAYRVGQIPATIHLCELDADDAPAGPVTQLSLGALSTDDPRLFTFRDRLHVAYSGRRFDDTGGIGMYYARLTDDWTVEAIHRPQYAKARPVEKNWGFFEHAGELRAVYSIRPHVVLGIDGDRIASVTETPNALPWSGGHLRGGAPPVRVGDEYWSWFHGCDGDGPARKYNVGLYTFEAQSPFGITRLAPHPLLWATDAPDTSYQTAGVIFPGGATLDGTTWTIASGVHDAGVELRRYDHAKAREWLGG